MVLDGAFVSDTLKRPFSFQFIVGPLKTCQCFCKLKIKRRRDGHLRHLRDFAESFLEGSVQQSSTVFLKNTKK